MTTLPHHPAPIHTLRNPTPDTLHNPLPVTLGNPLPVTLRNPLPVTLREVAGSRNHILTTVESGFRDFARNDGGVLSPGFDGFLQFFDGPVVVTGGR